MFSYTTIAVQVDPQKSDVTFLIYMYRTISLFSLLLVAAEITSTSAIGENKAWNTDAQSGYFGAQNWSVGDVGVAGGTEVLYSYDSLYFSASSQVLLNNNLSEATFENITFNPEASAYTISGNLFYLSGKVVNWGPNSQIINNDIKLSSLTTIIDVTGDIALGGVLSGNSMGITKAGTGKLTLSGANTYTGPTVVEKGTLALGPNGSIGKSAKVTLASNTTLDVSAISGGYHIALGETVGGRGRINAPTTVDAGGMITVTDTTVQPGTLQVEGGLVLEGTTLMAIRKIVVAEADRIQVNGESSTLKFGGTLVLTNMGEFAHGNTFTLFTAPNFAGAFSGLVLQPWPDSALRVDLSQLREGGNGTIKILNGNRQPTANDINLAVEKNGTVSFELLKYASDPDGDFLTPTFEQLDPGEKVTFTNGVVTYKPPSNMTGPRSFYYRVTDSSGFSSSDPPATISVTISASSGSGANLLSISGTAPGPITVSFAGIPGHRYQGQFSSDLSGWIDIGGPVPVEANGKGSFVHSSAPEGAGFYRTRWVGSASTSD